MTTDADLYTRWINGDHEAGGELIDRHTGSLHRWLRARTREPDDIVQATWLVALRSRSYAGRGSFAGWLKRIAWSQLRDERSEAGHLEARSVTSPSRAVLRRELAQAVEELSHEGVRVTAQRLLEGQQPKSIAAELGVSEKTVWSHIRIATQKLRERLRA